MAESEEWACLARRQSQRGDRASEAVSSSSAPRGAAGDTTAECLRQSPAARMPSAGLTRNRGPCRGPFRSLLLGGLVGAAAAWLLECTDSSTANALELLPTTNEPTSSSSSSSFRTYAPYSHLQLSAAAAAPAAAEGAPSSEKETQQEGGRGDSSSLRNDAEETQKKEEGKKETAEEETDANRPPREQNKSDGAETGAAAAAGAASANSSGKESGELAPEASSSGSKRVSPGAGEGEEKEKDLLLDLFGEEALEPAPLSPLDELKADLDPVILELEEHIFGSPSGDGDRKSAAAAASPDMMDASLDLSKLARSLDLGEQAAEAQGGDSRLLESLPAEEAPEALRGLASLEGQELVAGYLVRLHSMHRRLGLSLREAMTSFLASVEKEKMRSAALAALIGVSRLRHGVETASKQRQREASAGAELQLLRQQHKYLGKQRKQLRRKLKWAAADHDSLPAQIEDMWAPVDAAAAFDPGRGSSFFPSLKLVGSDAHSAGSTCAKLLLLLGHLQQEGARATRQQLAKEDAEEDELMSILNPDTGPLAALSSPSLTTLSRSNPEALRQADAEFMGPKRAASRRKPQQLQQLAGALSAAMAPPAGRRVKGEVGPLEFGEGEEEAPEEDPLEVFFTWPLGGDRRQQQKGSPERAATQKKKELHQGADAAAAAGGELSFLQLHAEVTPQEPQPSAAAAASPLAAEHQQQSSSKQRLSSIAPHESVAAADPTFLLLQTGSKADEEEEEDEEEEDKEGAGGKRASEGESATASQASAGERDSAASLEAAHTGASSSEKEEKEEKEKAEHGIAAAKSSSQDKAFSAAAAAAAAAAASAAEAVAEQKKANHEMAPSVTMLSHLVKGSACEAITDPAACMQRENCFQDFIYGACFFNCTTVETPEECERHTFCRFEKHVPHNACVNEGYQTTDAMTQRFEGILRGCEHFTKKETCDWMYEHGQRLLEAEKQEKQKQQKQQQQQAAAAGGQISSTAHLGPSPYHCQWMSGAPEEAAGKERDKGDKRDKEIGGSSVCGNLKEAPTAERLLWGTVVAEKEKKLRELKTTEHVDRGDICVRPSDRLAVLRPNRPFYSVGSIFSCLPGAVLLGVSGQIECQADGTFSPALACVEESDLSQGQLQHIRRRASSKAKSNNATPLSAAPCSRAVLPVERFGPARQQLGRRPQMRGSGSMASAARAACRVECLSPQRIPFDASIQILISEARAFAWLRLSPLRRLLRCTVTGASQQQTAAVSVLQQQHASSLQPLPQQ
ncbi:hypothetical protein Efla_003832 [Eimeria flavescens]